MMADAGRGLSDSWIKELARGFSKEMENAEQIRRAGGDVSAVLESLELPQDGSKDFIPFDPACVRVRKGRVKFPGLGRVKADCPAPPRGARLIRADIRRDGDGWLLRVAFETP